MCHHVVTSLDDHGSPSLLQARPTTRERALVPVLVFLGMVVSVVSSLGAPLVPTIARTEHVSLATAQWSLTVTLLAGALATPTMGRLADGPRRRQVVLGALTAVVLGSILAALPLDFGWLVAGRALQGLGLGMTPLTIAVARDHLPAERARSAVSLLSITTVAGVGLGYPLTGLIATRYGVHGGFWFGAVVALLALVLGLWVVPSSRDRAAHRLDAGGALLLAGGLAALLLALSEGETWGWASLRVLSALAVSVVLLAAFVRQELRTVHPLVDLRLLRSRAVLTADVTGLFAGVGMYLLLSLVTRFVQTPTSYGYGFGASVVVGGLVLLPFSVASVLASRVVPMIARRFGVDRVLPVGCAVFLVAMGVFLVARNNIWEVCAVMSLAGLGVGCTFAAMPGLIVRAVPGSETGSAMSVNQVLRTLGYSIGSALSGTVLEAYTPAGSPLPTGDGYRTAALLGLGVWVLTGTLSAVLPGRSRPAPQSPAVDELEKGSGEGGAAGVPLLDEPTQTDRRAGLPVLDRRLEVR